MNTTKAHALSRLDQAHPDPGPHAVLALNGLRLLLEAHHCVRELEADAWEFALEIACLKAAGLTNTNLRCLLYRGCALQGGRANPAGNAAADLLEKQIVIILNR